MYILYRFLFVNPLGTRPTPQEQPAAQTRARLSNSPEGQAGSAASGRTVTPTHRKEVQSLLGHLDFFRVEEFPCGELEHTHN